MNEPYQPKPKPLLPLLLACLAVALYCNWVSYRAPLESLIERGGPGPQYLLGNCYFKGISIGQNSTQAVKWYRLAADQGDAKAQVALGMMYLQGNGVVRDYKTALKLFRQAAHQGHDMAQNELGMMYTQGKGVPQDLDAAVEWFEKAASHGCHVAEQNLRLLAATRPSHMASLTLRNGKTYRAVNVRKVEWDGLTISYQPCPGGLGETKLRFRDLPDALRSKCLGGGSVQLADAMRLAEVVVKPM